MPKVQDDSIGRIGYYDTACERGAKVGVEKRVRGDLKRVAASFPSARLVGSLAILTTVFLLAGACATPLVEVGLPSEGDKFTRVFVVNYGWHSGIAIRKSDISEGVLPEVRDFPDARFIEIGWGDWDYYQAADPGLGLLLKAAFWPTRSVLYLVGITGAMDDHVYDDVVELVLDDQMFQRFMEFVSGTFLRPDPTFPAHSRPGLHPASRFYPARGRFHVLRNCNTWVAEALRFGGLPIRTTFVVTAGTLMHRVRSFEAKGTPINSQILKLTSAGISIRHSIEDDAYFDH